VVESPLLFEAGSTARYTATIAVVAADALREQRLAGRDQVSLGEREALQLSQAEKARLATHVVINDGSVEQLREQLSGVLAQLSS
jgi:dephospho-CoA kinase